MPKSVISCQTQTGPPRSAFWRISVRRFGDKHVHATSFLKPQRCNGQFHSHHPIKLSHARQREDYGAEPFHTKIFTPGDCPRAIVHPPVGAPHGPHLKSLCVLGVLRVRHPPHAESAEHAEAVYFAVCPQRNQTRSNILLRHLDRIESALAALHVEMWRPRLTIADCLVAIAHGIQLRPFAENIGEARFRR